MRHLKREIGRDESGYTQKTKTSENEEVQNGKDVTPGVLSNDRGEDDGEVRHGIEQRVEHNKDKNKILEKIQPVKPTSTVGNYRGFCLGNCLENVLCNLFDIFINHFGEMYNFASSLSTLNMNYSQKKR